MTRHFGARRLHPAGDRPDRAVIDIGSNTVRLVVYSGSQRAPDVWLNEKVTARLGRELSETGRIPGKATELALTGLARFAAILTDIGVEDVQTVATAAARDAENGPEFLEKVRALDLEPRLLSGEEEARLAAFGVIGAFPGARGTVADLGGGSLELVMIEAGDCHDATSLPLGTLRLPGLGDTGSGEFRRNVQAEVEKAGWAAAHPGPLYMVGGTWRALAAYAMRKSKHPLTDPHGYRMTSEEADRIAKKVSQMEADALSSIKGISSSRAAGLPAAAAMLRVILADLKPDGLVFSSWGLREGLLFSRLGAGGRGQDPLLAAVAHFAEPRGGSTTLATMIAAWSADALNGKGNGTERLRLAATMLALAAARTEPNLRVRHAYDWAMDKRWLDLAPSGRARIAAALLASCGKPNPPDDLRRIASEEELREAGGWGLAIRLCRRLGGGSRFSLLTSSLKLEDEKLVLWIDPERAQLVTDVVGGDLQALAQWLGRESEIRIGEAAAG